MNNSISKEWEQIHVAEDWGKYPTEPVIRFVAQYYYKEDRKSKKILDFGCGQGANTWYLAREGFDTYAFDGAPSAVEKAKAMLKADGLEAHFEVMDGANISYKKDYFDAVIDSACIGHNRIEDIKTMYSEVYEILKEDGRLFTTFFSTNTSGFGTGENVSYNTYREVTTGPLKGLGIVHFWEEDEFRTTIESAGFKDVEIEKSFRTSKGSVIDSFILTAVKKQ